jgi:hypothetical protein
MRRLLRGAKAHDFLNKLIAQSGRIVRIEDNRALTCSVAAMPNRVWGIRCGPAITLPRGFCGLPFRSGASIGPELQIEANLRAGANLSALERLKREERLGELSPERCLIPAEPVHDVVIEIGQAQEADRDIARCARDIGSDARRLKLLLTVCLQDDVLADLGAASGQGLGSPLPG